MKRALFEDEILSRDLSSFSEWFTLVTNTKGWEASYELENIWRSLSGYTDSVRLMPKLTIMTNRSFYLASAELVLFYTSEREPETVFWFTQAGEKREWKDWCFTRHWPWGDQKYDAKRHISDLPKELWPKIFGFINDPGKEVLLARYPLCKWWIHMGIMEPMKSYFNGVFKGRSLLEARVLYDRHQKWLNRRRHEDPEEKKEMYPTSQLFWTLYMENWASDDIDLMHGKLMTKDWILDDLFLDRPRLKRKKDKLEWYLKLDFNGLVGRPTTFA